MLFEYTDLTGLDSSWMKAAYYNEQSGELAVEMKDGRSYVYAKVPASALDGLADAFSAGSYYNRYIQGRYTNVYGGPVTMKYERLEVSAKMAETKTKTYTVRAIVPFEAQIEASSLDEAVRLFAESHNDVKGVTIKEVVVPFGE